MNRGRETTRLRTREGADGRDPGPDHGQATWSAAPKRGRVAARSIRRAAALLLLLLLAACARSTSPSPVSSPSSSGSSPPAPGPDSPAAAALRGELLAWIVVSDLDGALERIAVQVGSPRGKADAAGARDALLTRLGVPADVAKTIDTRRAIAIAFLDPSRGSKRGLALALPIASSPEFRAALSDGGVERTVGRRRIYGTGDAQVFVELEGTPGREIAYVSFDERIAGGAAPLLARLLAQAPARSFTLHASIERLTRCCAQDLEAITTALVALVSPTGPGAVYGAFGLRQAARALSRTALASDLEVGLAVGTASTTLSLRTSAPAGSPFAMQVAEQPTGPPWGVELVPDDAMLVYTSRLAPNEAAGDAELLSRYLAAVAPDPAVGRQAAAWKRGELAPLLTGEVVHAAWAGELGGMGAGGAFRVSDGRAARAALTRLYRRGSAALGGAVANHLGLDPKRFRFEASFRTDRALLRGVPVDLVELRPRFPADGDHERKMVAWLFGDRPALALAVVGDRVLYAVGRDWRERLEGMIGVAGGSAPPSNAFPVFADARRHQGRVTQVYLSTARLAGFVVAALRAAGTVDPSHEAALAPFLADADAAIVSGSRAIVRDGRASYEVSTTVPAVILSDLGLIGGAMWRVAVSPLFGAPAVPPLATPPPTITPPAGRPPPPAPATPTPGAPTPDLPTGRGA